jgi:hypothetical protein
MLALAAGLPHEPGGVKWAEAHADASLRHSAISPDHRAKLDIWNFSDHDVRLEEAIANGAAVGSKPWQAQCKAIAYSGTANSRLDSANSIRTQGLQSFQIRPGIAAARSGETQVR